jgi:hypothetical protein
MVVSEMASLAQSSQVLISTIHRVVLADRRSIWERFPQMSHSENDC